MLKRLFGAWNGNGKGGGVGQLDTAAIVLDALPVAVAVADIRDADTVLTYVNPAFSRLTGFGAQAVLGREPWFLQAPHTEAAARLRRAMAQGRAVEVELALQRQDGQTVCARVRSAVVGDGVGGALRHVMVLTEVHGAALEEERRRHAQALERVRHESEQAMRAKMRFFASASHDLRQPMQALALFISALEARVDTSGAATIMGSIKTSLKSMEEMFDSVLSISRLDAGVQQAQATDFLVGDVFERLEDEFAALAAAKGLRLRVVPSSLGVCSDPTLLARILRNFLANAVRYTQSGGVLMGCRRRGATVSLQVWDTGCGIVAAQRQAIFQAFYQIPTAEGGAQGVGLGLAIVQRLARLLDHELDVRSRPGRGSMFSIDVPISERMPGLVDDTADDDDGAACALPSAVVLVIDDDPEILAGLGLLLQDWGLTVIGATSGAEALEALSCRAARPDVVLADLWLRNQVSGVAVIGAVQDFLRAKVPAFVLTGDTESCAQVGGYPVLLKPINAQRLRAVLAEVLAGPSPRSFPGGVPGKRCSGA